VSGNQIELGVKLTADGSQLRAEAKDVSASFNDVTDAVTRNQNAAAQLNTAYQNLSPRISKMAGDYAGIDQAMRQVNVTQEASSDEVSKLLAKYDQQGAKLRQLQDDFNTLNRAALSGDVAARDDTRLDNVYANILAQIAQANGAVGDFANASESGMNRTTHATAGMTRELIVLGHEAMSGNFSRIPGSIMVLAERMNFMMGPIALVTGALFAGYEAWKHYADGAKKSLDSTIETLHDQTQKIVDDLEKQVSLITKRNDLLRIGLTGNDASVSTIGGLAQRIQADAAALKSWDANSRDYAAILNDMTQSTEDYTRAMARLVDADAAGKETKKLQDQAKAHKDLGNAYRAEEDAGKAWMASMNEATKIQDQLDGKTQNLTKAQQAMKAYMESGYAEINERLNPGMNELLAVTLGLASANEDQAATTDAATAAQNAQDKQNANTIEGELKALQALRTRNDLMEKGITTVAEMNVAELELQLTQAAGNDAEIANLGSRLEIAREYLTETQRGAADKSMQDSARQAEQYWHHAANSIANDITNAIMNGGKSARDILINIFDNLVLRPIVQMEVSGAMSAFGLGGSMISGSAAASGLSDITGAAGIFSGFGAGLQTTIAMATQGGILSGMTTGFTAGVSAIESGGISAGLGMMVPWLAAGAVALGVISSHLGGETRSGGEYTVNSSGGVNYIQGPSGGQFATDQVTSMLGSFPSTINTILATYGSSQTVTNAQGGLETSTEGRGGAYAGGQLSGGATFGDTRNTRINQSMTGDQAIAQLTGDMTASALEALKAADLPGLAGDYLKSLTVSTPVDAAGRTDSAAITQYTQELQFVSNSLKLLTDTAKLEPDAVNAVVMNLKDLTRSGETLDQAGLRLNSTLQLTAQMAMLSGKDISSAFGQESLASVELRQHIIDLMGGTNAASSTLNSYYQNFYSQGERAAMELQSQTAILTNLGITTIPKTNEQFRALVDSIDTSTTAGAELYAALLNDSGAFNRMTADANTAAAATSSWSGAVDSSMNSVVDSTTTGMQIIQMSAGNMAAASSSAAQTVSSTWTSTLDALKAEENKILGVMNNGSAANLQTQFAIATAQARAGDQAAANSLAGLADSLLAAEQQTASSSLDYARMQAQVVNSLQETAKIITSPQSSAPVVSLNQRGSGLSSASPDRSQELVKQLQTTNSKLDQLIGANGKIQKNTADTHQILRNVTQGRNSLLTTPA
jgi:hypothetical protein